MKPPHVVKSFSTRMIRVSLLAVAAVVVFAVVTASTAAPATELTTTGSPRTFSGHDLYGHINGGAELFLEFGFEELQVQRYHAGEAECVREAYRMDSPAAALGIYLAKCGKETPTADLTARNTVNRYQLTVVQGPVFLQINNFSGDESLLPAMVSLARQGLADIPPTASLSTWDYLPDENRLDGSELLIRGPFALQPIFTLGEDDILQLHGEIFGVVADYYDDMGHDNARLDNAGQDSAGTTGPHSKCRDFGDGWGNDTRGGSSDDEITARTIHTRIIIPYPDETMARAAFEHLVANLDPYLELSGQSDSGFRFKDYRGKYGLARLSGRVLEVRVNLEAAPAQ